MPLRPPFTGIHEIPPLRGDPGMHEGGGPQPPYGEDIVNRIVDVNWGGGPGGVFASGDHCCFFRYADIPKATVEQKWIGLGSLDFGDSGTINSGSYARVNGRPTFLMGGYGLSTRLMVSHDGINWTSKLDTSFPGVDAIVWNTGRKKFYGATRSNVISSPDGYSWKEEPGMIDTDVYAMSRSGEGDGVVGYDPKNDLMIIPQSLNGVFNGIQMYMECTGFVGGVWMAGGEVRDPETGQWTSGTITSIDGGKNWEIVSYGAIGMRGNYSVVIMLAAPNSDF